MNKKCILIIAFAISAHAFCQNEDYEKEPAIRLGMKAGIVFADLSTKYPPSYQGPSHKLTLKAMGGFFANVKLNESTSFRPEFLMIGKGTRYKLEYFTSRETLTYLELPLNILYKPGAKSSFFVGGGPAPSYYIGRNLFYTGYTEIKRFDFGINAVTGFEGALGFSINLHYTHGLVNLSREKGDVPALKNRCFGLSIGYLF